MKLSIAVVVCLLIFFVFTTQARAIIFLPALILIPIAKIVGLILAGFSLPAVSISAIYSFLFKKSFKQSIFSVLGMLLIMGLLLAIGLKLFNPDRPLW